MQHVDAVLLVLAELQAALGEHVDGVLRVHVVSETTTFKTIDIDYMDCRHRSARNILRHAVALPSYVFTVVRARAHRFGPWYNQSFWYNTMVYVSYIVETEAVNANNKKKYNYAVSSNVAVRGDSSPC